MKKGLFYILILSVMSACGSFADKTHQIGKIVNGNTIQLAGVDSFIQVKLLGVNCDGDLMDPGIKEFLEGKKIKIEYDPFQLADRFDTIYPSLVRGTVDTSIHTTIYAYVYVRDVDEDLMETADSEVFLNQYLLDYGNATAYSVPAMKYYDEWRDAYKMSDYQLNCALMPSLGNGLCEEYETYAFNKNISPEEEVAGELCSCIESATVKITTYININKKLYRVSTGSGYLINETGQVLTNHHVVILSNDFLEILNKLKIFDYGLVYTLSFKNDTYKDTLLAATPADVLILSTMEEFDLAVISPSYLLPIINPTKYEEMRNFDRENMALNESNIFGDLLEVDSQFSFPYLFFQNRQSEFPFDEAVAIIGSGEGLETIVEKGKITGTNKGGNSFTYNAKTYHGHSGSCIINNRGLVIGIGTKTASLTDDGLYESVTSTVILSLLDDNDIYYHEFEY